MKRFSLLSVALLFFAVACSDSPAPGTSLTAPRSALLAGAPGNSPPPPVDAYVAGEIDGAPPSGASAVSAPLGGLAVFDPAAPIPFVADGRFFSNEESIQAAIALGTLTVEAAEQSGHAWLQLNDAPAFPQYDVSSNAKFKKQGERLSGQGTITVTQGGDVILIRIDQVLSFVSNPECGTTRFCGNVVFTATVSVNGGQATPRTGRVTIINRQFLCEVECCAPSFCGPS